MSTAFKHVNELSRYSYLLVTSPKYLSLSSCFRFPNCLMKVPLFNVHRTKFLAPYTDFFPVIRNPCAALAERHFNLI
jgi:hypothetical protein